MRNRFPTICKTCSAHVPAEAGEIRKIRGKWIGYCAAHAKGTPPIIAAPIEHDDYMPWPNGGGITPCSHEYREAAEELGIAERDAREAQSAKDCSAWNEAMTRIHKAQSRVADLQLAGHLGKPETFERPNRNVALEAHLMCGSEFPTFPL